MKTHNQKIGDIMKLGFSKKTLSLMTESQVNALHKRLVNEQTAPTGKVMTKDPRKAVEVAKAGANVELTEKKSKKGKNPWAICTSSLSDEFGTSERSEWTKGQMNKYERCVKGVKKTIEEGKNPYEFLIEQKMSELVEKHLTPKISKKDLLEAIRIKKLNEQIAPAKPDTDTDTDTDFDPWDEPYPNEDAEAKNLKWFMSKVKRMGMFNKKKDN